MSNGILIFEFSWLTLDWIVHFFMAVRAMNKEKRLQLNICNKSSLFSYQYNQIHLKIIERNWELWCNHNLGNYAQDFGPWIIIFANILNVQTVIFVLLTFWQNTNLNFWLALLLCWKLNEFVTCMVNNKLVIKEENGMQIKISFRMPFLGRKWLRREFPKD